MFEISMTFLNSRFALVNGNITRFTLVDQNWQHTIKIYCRLLAYKINLVRSGFKVYIGKLALDEAEGFKQQC